MNAFDRYLAEVSAAANRRRITPIERRALLTGIGVPLAFLLLLIAFCPH